MRRCAGCFRRWGWSDKKLDDEDAVVVAYVLTVSAVLQVLFLSENCIGDEGAEALAGGLCVNRVLTKLELSENNIGDKGAEALAEALNVNKVLTQLDLEANHSIKKHGKKQVLDAVQGRRGFNLYV